MIHVDTRQATREMSRMVAAAVRTLPPAAVAIARAAAGDFAREVTRVSPNDTNRFVRGWALAAAGAGAPGVVVPPLRPSKYRALQRAQLERQIENLAEELESTRQGIVSLTRALDRCGYTSRGRPLDEQGRKWTSRLADLKLLEPAYQRLHARAGAELVKFNQSPYAVVFGLGRGGVFRYMKTADAANEASGILPDLELIAAKSGRRRVRGASLVVTIRGKVYGGVGRLIQSGSQAGVFLHNREAHSSVVQRQSRAVSRALALSGAGTMRDVKPKIVRELKLAMRLEEKGAGRG